MRSVIVTGVSKGLGRAIAERLLEKGVHVIGISRTKCAIEGVEGYCCDVTDYEGLKSIYSKLRKSRTISGLVNAAGVASMNLTFSTPKEVVSRLINVNLVGTIYCCQLFGKLLAREGNGSILNFSTIAVRLGLKGESVYIASKAGVEGFTRSFAREMAEFNVTVNAIAPGPIDTNLIKNVSKQQIDDIVDQQIISKKATPNDVADLASLLLQKEASMISGETIHVGGA